MYKQGGIKKSILFIIAIAAISAGYSQNTNSANGEKSTELVAFEKPSKKVLKKAKKSLDWEPEYNLNKGIEELVNWFKNE